MAQLVPIEDPDGVGDIHRGMSDDGLPYPTAPRRVPEALKVHFSEPPNYLVDGDMPARRCGRCAWIAPTRRCSPSPRSSSGIGLGVVRKPIGTFEGPFRCRRRRNLGAAVFAERPSSEFGSTPAKMLPIGVTGPAVEDAASLLDGSPSCSIGPAWLIGRVALCCSMGSASMGFGV